MKVYIQVVNTLNGVHQSGMIDEPVKEGMEVSNALSHFGLRYGEINWEMSENSYKIGRVDNASKIVSIITRA